MDISRRNARRLSILSVLVALSIGLVIAANSGTNVINTPSVGTNLTIKVSITDANFTGTDQWVKIVNKGTINTSLTGWKLMNKANQAYSFPVGFTLKPNAMVTVHTSTGTNTLKDLYNSGLAWNKTSDTATLENASGKIISQYKYPVVKISVASANFTEADQWVKIANKGTSNTDLTGWKLMNKANQAYSFPVGFTLKPNAMVTIHTSTGTNTLTDLYNSGLAWNKTSDVVTLKNVTGKAISQYKYPPAVKTPTKSNVTAKAPVKT